MCEVSVEVSDEENHVTYHINAVEAPALPPEVLMDPTSVVSYLT